MDPRTRLVGLSAITSHVRLGKRVDSPEVRGWQGSRREPRAVSSALLEGDTWAGTLFPSLPSCVAPDTSWNLSAHFLTFNVI